MNRAFRIAAFGIAAVWAGVAAFAQEPPPSKPAPQPQPPVAPHTAPPKATLPPVDPAHAPKIELSASEWDFGTKWYGAEAKTDVTIKNVGKGPLTIGNIRTSCGCTLAKPKSGGAWQNKVIEPGQSETMELSYNTKKHTTKVSQTVTIESNDPSSPTIQFMVKGELKTLCKMEPTDRITFGRLERDQVQEQTMTLTSNYDKPLKLTLKPLPDSAHFDVKISETEPGKAWKIQVTTKPPMTLGNNQLDLTFDTGAPEMPELSVPINAYVAPRVTVMPQKIFTSTRMTQPFERLVRVTYPVNKPVNIVSVKSDNDKVTAELQPKKDPPSGAVMGYAEIKVKLPPGSELANGAKLTITTDDPDPEYKTLTVEVVSRETVTRTTPTPAVQAPSPSKPTAAPAGPSNAASHQPKKP